MTSGGENSVISRRWSPGGACLLAYGAALAAAIGVGGLWADGPALWVAFAADIAATLVVAAIGMGFRNASLYDPYWSVAPPLILAYWIWRNGGFEALTIREALALVLVSLWAVRLTVNCMRRWRDLAHEDFRYRDLRAASGPWFPLVNLFGIALFPTLLVFAGMVALYPVTVSETPLGWLDALAVLVTGAAICIEAQADEQLVRFKRDNTVPGKVCDTGLWRRSQHPNYFGEILFWWGLWLFALAADPAWWATIIGPLAMTALFTFISIPMMLKRKRARYPDYDGQVAGIPVLVPRLWGSTMNH